ncbi:MAG: CCE_0567 family metalloprotein [Azospirillaceae bacterium]|nr:CCE_0567 family metalloprotein [Azospirillaceae bacterium]
MSDIDALKNEIKKQSARAMQAKMDLHDLSEELPINWPSILEVAQRTHDAFAVLEAKRADLKALETAWASATQMSVTP